MKDIKKYLQIPSRMESRLYRAGKKRRLRNRTPSILSHNCNGGIILHDLGLVFNTPMINTGATPQNFIKFLSDISKYVEAEDSAFMDTGRIYDGCFVASLLDIEIILAHSDSFEEGYINWNRRKNRINFNNLFIFMTDQTHDAHACTYEDLLAFDRLPHKNKVIFTYKEYPEIQSAYYIRGFEEKGEVGILSDYKRGYFKRRFLDDFDYVSFFNGVPLEEIKKKRR